jgi:Protease II
VSDDSHLLAYSTDVTGFREYTLYVKDLRTGTLLPGTIDKVSSVAWAADNATIFYVTEDEAKRPYRFWRHRPGIAGSDLVYEETDQLFRIGVERSRSRAFLFLGAGSFTSSEWRYLPAHEPAAVWQMLMPREKDHEYAVDHGGDRFYIRTNGSGLRNFRLVSAPIDDPRPQSFTELVPHRESVMLEDVEVFASHFIVHEREGGLTRLHITWLADGSTHHIEFPEPAYEVSADANAEFDTRLYRFRYQSLITPASVFDYDVITRARTLLKQTEVLGGYDPRALPLRADLGHRPRRRVGAHLPRVSRGDAPRRHRAHVPDGLRRLRHALSGDVLVQSAEPARSRLHPWPSATSAEGASSASAGTTRAA